MGWGKHFYSPLIGVHVVYYQPLCHSCFHLSIIFKFVASRNLCECWKQMMMNSCANRNPYVFSSYRMLNNINLFSDWFLYQYCICMRVVSYMQFVFKLTTATSEQNVHCPNDPSSLQLLKCFGLCS